MIRLQFNLGMISTKFKTKKAANAYADIQNVLLARVDLICIQQSRNLIESKDPRLRFLSRQIHEAYNQFDSSVRLAMSKVAGSDLPIG